MGQKEGGRERERERDKKEAERKQERRTMREREREKERGRHRDGGREREYIEVYFFAALLPTGKGLFIFISFYPSLVLIYKIIHCYFPESFPLVLSPSVHLIVTVMNGFKHQNKSLSRLNNFSPLLYQCFISNLIFQISFHRTL